MDSVQMTPVVISDQPVSVHAADWPNDLRSGDVVHHTEPARRSCCVWRPAVQYRIDGTPITYRGWYVDATADVPFVTSRVAMYMGLLMHLIAAVPYVASITMDNPPPKIISTILLLYLVVMSAGMGRMIRSVADRDGYVPKAMFWVCSRSCVVMIPAFIIMIVMLGHTRINEPIYLAIAIPCALELMTIMGCLVFLQYLDSYYDLGMWGCY